MAGIEASTITSLGTCRLVIPRSESTIASVGPLLVGALDRGLDRLALVVGEALERAEDAGQAVVRARAGRASASPCSANTSAKNARTAWPKMIGSETFIIVAFRCSEKRTPCALASAICSARKASSARRRMTAPSKISPASTGTCLEHA